MFSFAFNKLKRWFNYVTTPINENDLYLEVLRKLDKIQAPIFTKIHSSHFSNYTVTSYKNSLDEYNLMLYRSLMKRNNNFLPIDFSNKYTMPISEYFLKEGSYVDEVALVETFVKYNKSITEWLLKFESVDNFNDTDCKYIYFKTLFNSSQLILNSLLDIQEEILLNF